MRILVINKYLPPDPAPTAALAGDLSAMLEEMGAEVMHVGGSPGYREARPQGWRRWLCEIQHLLRLFRSGLTVKKPDCILCLSDPPGVLFVAAILAKVKGAKLVHWAMDVYPDTAVALGEVHTGSLVHRFASLAMSFAYRSCKLVACLDADMLRHLHLNEDPRSFISPPWPPLRTHLPDTPVTPSGGRIRWMYSGNLGRAHEYETLLRAQQILEEAGLPFDLVFQGGGNAWTAAKSLAANLELQHCQWENYASAEELVPSLLQAHVLIATQRQQVKGLLWPSKLAVLKLLPRPIVWVGPLDGSIATDLRAQNLQHGVFACGDFHGLAEWLAQHASAFVSTTSASFSPASLRPAFSSLAQAEGKKWWSHLTQMLLPDSPSQAGLNVPLPGKPA